MGRYTDITNLVVRTGQRFKSTTFYPDIPLGFDDIYVYTDEGDRFDILAQTYYSDSSLWWVIASANPQFNQGSMFPPLGVQIRIPSNVGSIVNQYNALNNV
tara:strand:- start:140 stop:442 length:303 start_codon:yes stop_codon:yes gene_type:complete